ncbi:hypothetical protein [Nonomuraea sp. B5E05]|uniref:hypothetical protein n=1 Tax=Nonomuraea sp. B5E05 TaxID=3153569 RepID=UPI0032607787
MSGGFFTRMARRATGREPLARLRVAQPFEVPLPEWPVETGEGRPAIASTRPSVPRSTVGTARGPLSRTPQAAMDGPAESVTTIPEPTAGRPPTPSEPPGSPVRSSESQSPRVRSHEEQSLPAEPDDDRDSPGPDIGPAPSPSAPSPADPPAAGSVRAPVWDVARLLREHLGPELVARDVVEPRDRLIFVDRLATAGAAPKPGTAEVRTSEVRPAARTLGAPCVPASPSPIGDVHLRIDRVVVTRAAAPPPPAPPPQPPSTVDHAAYLARRREDR